MPPLVECVPNFSEGRRPEVVEAIVEAIRQAAPVHILDYSSDADHNRTVVTFVGAPADVEAAAFAGIKTAATLIDLNKHEGAHPRIGATDVCPFVPLRDVTLEDCVAMAKRVGERVGTELHIPVYFYEAAATRPDRENLARIRKGNYEGLRDVIGSDPARIPDCGPREIGPAGATVIGARPFLVAFNVYLNTDDVSIAKKIAKAVRHSGGGMRYLKALGLLVDGRAQVSMNFTNFEKTPLYRVVELIRREAARYGALVTDSELIGLVPQTALIDSAQWYLQLDNLQPRQIIENQLAEIMAKPDHVEDESSKDTVLSVSGARRIAADSTLRPEAFLNAVAGGNATPGGGAVAALVGALSASLVAMVARLTVGKKHYVDVESEMQDVTLRADRVRTKLADAIAEDVAAFEAVMAAYKLDKNDPRRAEKIQAALMGAADVPLRVAKLALRSLRLAREVAAVGNKNAATDAGVAAHTGLAAVEGAALNVLVNVEMMANGVLADQVRKEIQGVCSEARALHRRIVTVVEDRAGIG